VIRVLLVHDIGLMQSALAELLAKEKDLDVFSAPWHSVRLRARCLRPHVCVVDADTPSAEPLAAAVEVTGSADGGQGKAAGQRAGGGGNGGSGGSGGALLALVSVGRPGALRRALDARALGFVSKSATPQRLLDGIRKVAKGERFVDESLAFGFLQAVEMPLTARELSVLSLAAEGAPISEIARSLHLCNGTVRNYMASVIRKTGARNRVDAIRISRGGASMSFVNPALSVLGVSVPFMRRG